MYSTPQFLIGSLVAFWVGFAIGVLVVRRTLRRGAALNVVAPSALAAVPVPVPVPEPPKEPEPPPPPEKIDVGKATIVFKMDDGATSTRTVTGSALRTRYVPWPITAKHLASQILEEKTPFIRLDGSPPNTHRLVPRCRIVEVNVTIEPHVVEVSP